MNTLLSIAEVNPTPGTYVIVEALGDKAFRIALKCPRCLTTYYDFFGVGGRKASTLRRVKLECKQCVVDREKRREAHFAEHGSSEPRYGYRSRAPLFTEEYPKVLLLPLDKKQKELVDS